MRVGRQAVSSQTAWFQKAGSGTGNMQSMAGAKALRSREPSPFEKQEGGRVLAGMSK